MKIFSFSCARFSGILRFCFFGLTFISAQEGIHAQSLTVNGDNEAAPFIGTAGADYSIVAPTDINIGGNIVTLQGGEGSILIKDGVTWQSTGGSALFLYDGASYKIENSGKLLSTNSVISGNGGSFTIGNKGDISGDLAISISSAANVVVTNSGSLSGNQVGVFAETTNFSIAGSSLVSISNTGSIEGANQQALQLRATSEFGADSTITLENSGDLEGHLGAVSLAARSSQSDAGGTGNAAISFKNSGSVSSFVGSALDAEANALGVGSGSIVAFNSGTFTINGAFDGMALRAYSQNGAGQATVDATNAGSILNANVGINATATTGVTDAAASGNAGITITNSGTIDAATGVSATAAANGTGSAGITFSNSSSISAVNSGLEVFANNNYGSGSAVISGNNSGTVTAGSSSGILAVASSNLLDSSGSGNAATTLLNSGSVSASQNAMTAEAHAYGTGSAAVGLENTGFLGSDTAGALIGSAYVHGLAGADASLSATNSGTLDTTSGTAVDLGAFSFESTAGNATLSFANTGTITATSTGVSARARSNQGAASVSVTNSSSGLISTNTLHGILAQANADNGTASVRLINNGSVSSLAAAGNGLRAIAVGTTASNISLINTGSVNVGSGSAIYVSTSTPGEISIFNSGSISGDAVGIRLVGTQANTITLAGGSIDTGGNAVSGNGQSTVNVIGRSDLSNVIDGGGGTSLLNLKLVGMTPAEKAALEAANPTGDTVTVGGRTYTWQNFSGTEVQAVSLGQVVDKNLVSLATAIDKNAGNVGTDFDPFFIAASGDANAAVTTLAGKQVLDSRTSLALNQSTQLNEAIMGRGYQLAAGMQGFSSIGLQLQDASLLASLGGIKNELESMTAQTRSDSTVAPFALQRSPEQRWGTWISGTVMISDQNDTHNTEGYKATTANPTVGIDYQMTPQLRVGVTGSYSNTAMDFKDETKVKADTGTVGVYATYSKERWHVTGLVAGGYTGYDNKRQVFGNVAESDPDSMSFNAALSGGYTFTVKDWNLAPELGVQYTRLMVDGYKETGAGAFNLRVGEQDTDSLRSQVGFRLNRTFDLSWIKLSPSLRAAWYHEFLNDSRGVNSSLDGIGSFHVKTGDPERDFAILGAGISGTFTESDAITLFLYYNAQVGQEDYLAHTINGGFRYGF